MAFLIEALGRLRRWGKILGRFMLMQSIAQAAAVAAGIIIVRALGKEDYAYYTISNSWFGAFANLSNAGVTDTATAIGARVWRDPIRLGQVIGTVMRLRRLLAATAIVPVVGTLIWMLSKNGADLLTASSLALLVAVAGICQIAYSILVTVPRIKGDVRRLQFLELAGAFLRLGLTAVALFAFLDARAALAASLVALFVQYVLLRRWTYAEIDRHAAVDDDVRRELRRVIARHWPAEVYGVFQNQISVFLLSIFGTVNGVADLGAINRISVVFIVLISVTQMVVLPRYATCQDPRHLRTLFVEILMGFSVVAMIPAVVTFIAPHPILWVLGPRYEHLSVELFLVAVNAAMSSIGGIAWNLSTIRGWFAPWWLSIPISLTTQATAMLLIGVSTVRQVLMVATTAAGVGIVVAIVATLIFSRGFTRAGDPRRAFADS